MAQWVCEKSGASFTPLCRAIGQIYEGKLIAGLMYDGYTGSCIASHSRCDNPRHVSREFYFAIFNYPFNTLQVKQLKGLVSTANLKAQKVNEHLGFKREALLKDYFPDGDGIVYTMSKNDCRWLKLKDRYIKDKV